MGKLELFGVLDCVGDLGDRDVELEVFEGLFMDLELDEELAATVKAYIALANLR